MPNKLAHKRSYSSSESNGYLNEESKMHKKIKEEKNGARGTYYGSQTATSTKATVERHKSPLQRNKTITNHGRPPSSVDNSTLQLKLLNGDVITAPNSPYIETEKSKSKIGYDRLKQDSLTSTDDEEIIVRKSSSPELSDFVEQMYIDAVNPNHFNVNTDELETKAQKNSAAAFFSQLTDKNGRVHKVQPSDDEKFKGFPADKGYREEIAFDEITNFVLDSDYDTGKGFTSSDLISRTLHQLARDGNHRVLAMALDRLGEQIAMEKVNRLDQDQLAPLHYAARYAHGYTILTLLQKNADVNIKGADDLTPLHYAARYRKTINSGDKKKKIKEKLRTSRDPSPSNSEIIAETDDTFQNEEPADQVENERRVSYVSLDTQEDSTFIVKLLVDNGASLNAVDIYGLTPLHYAAMRGNDVAARDLLTFENIDLEAQDKQNMTPLFIATTYGYVDICRRLLEKGANLHTRDETLQTPLHRAAGEGHLEIVELLLNEAIKLHGDQTKLTETLSIKDAERQTALHVAVNNGHIQIIELLLKSGADVNSVRDTFATTLHAAAVVGNEDLLQILIDHGANVEAVDSHLQTPLHKASANDQSSAIKFLLKNQANIEKRDSNSLTPLLLAASAGHAQAIKVLLEHGAAVDALDKDDRTPIYWCAKEGHCIALEVLLEVPKSKELIDFSDRLDNSPLHESARNGHFKCLVALLENGSQIDNKNEDAETALHIAAEEGQTEVVQELIRRFRFLMNDENDDASTPLHLASGKGHKDVVEILLEAGADVEARDTALWTPLDCASANGHEAVCELLIEYGAPLDPFDKTKTTPLQLSAKNGHVGVTKLLLRHGASVSVMDASRRNALDLAIANGKKDVALAIVKSDQWLNALRITHFDGEGKKITPFRNLVKKFPDVAYAVLDRCVTTNGFDSEENDFGLRFNYEFLDDTYIIMEDLEDSTSLGSAIITKSAFNEDGKLLDEAVPYTSDQRLLKKYHPLTLMVKHRRSNLLGHPVSVSLVKEKWTKYARYIYYFNLIFYSIFLIFLTSYVVNAVDWKYAQYNALQNDSNVDINDCKKLEELAGVNETTISFATICKWVIIVMCAFHIMREIVQFYQARMSYLGFENLLEWVCYVGALVLVVDFAPDPNYAECFLRQEWQWQVGSVAIFLAWINLVLFLRKLPLFGIYVVMFTDVFLSFSRFFMVFFLFIIGFALSFYMIFRTQSPFETVGKSLMKTSVMMIGEFEYDNIFNDENAALNYPVVSYILFVSFLILMSILIMNLLVGLAVDDIKAVQAQAVMKRRAMQAQLIMDVEVLIPEFLRRKFAKIENFFFPNKKRLPLANLFSDFNLLYKYEYADPNIKSDDQEELDRKLNVLSDQINELQVQNKIMQQLLTATAAFQKKTWIKHVDKVLKVE